MIEINEYKRYLTYDTYLKRRFGKKVCKLPLDAGFSCPNIDGTKGFGGCSYCSARGSGDFAPSHLLPIEEQYEASARLLEKKWKDSYKIAYFQAHTNTHGDIERQRELFFSALGLKDLVGISIATRADCLPDEVCDMLARLSQRTYLTVELGLQSIHDATAERINRCHSYADFLCGYEKLDARGINICVHLINGLPGESREMMLESAKAVGALRPHAIKLHLLHIIRGTRIAKEYERGEFSAMSLDEYTDTVCEQLRFIPKETVIERVTGDGVREELIAPLWSLKKFVVMNEIDKKMASMDAYQGDFVQNA